MAKDWFVEFINGVSNAAGKKLVNDFLQGLLQFYLSKRRDRFLSDEIKNFKNWKNFPELVAQKLKHDFPFHFIGKPHLFNYKLVEEREKRKDLYIKQRFVFGSIEQQFYDALNEKQIIIVSGDTMSGKTRLVTDFLTNNIPDQYQNIVRKDDLIVVPKTDLFKSIDFPTLTLFSDIYQIADIKQETPEQYWYLEHIFLFFDDFERFALLDNPMTDVWNFIRNSQEDIGQRLKVIFTVRYGAEFKLVDDLINNLELNDEKIGIVKISRDIYHNKQIKRNYKQFIRNNFENYELKDFDGTFGSTLGLFSVKRKKYTLLKNFEQNRTQNPDEVKLLHTFFGSKNDIKIAYYTLKAFAFLHNSFNYDLSESEFKFEQLYDLVQKMIENEAPEIANYFNKSKLIDILENLQKHEFGLNFIEVKDSSYNRFTIDEVYLKKIIYQVEHFSKKIFEQTEYNIDNLPFDNKIKAKIFTYYPSPQLRTEKKFYIKFFTIAIQRAKDFNEAKEIFEFLKTWGIEQEMYSFNTLVSKALNLEQAQEIINERINKNLQPNEVTYSILINKAETFEHAKEIFKKMIQKKLQPNIFTYTNLIKKAESFKQALDVVNQMKKDNIQPNEVTYNTLIKKTENYRQARRVINEMIKNGITPNIYTYTILMSKTKTFKQAQQVINEMENISIKPNIVTLNAFMNKAQTFEQAKQIFEQILNYGLHPNDVTYTTLLNKTKNFEQAKEVVNQMKKNKIQLNEVTYFILIKKAGDFNKAYNLFRKFYKYKFIKTKQTVLVAISYLIGLADQVEAEKLLKMLVKNNITPNSITLVNWLKNYDYDPVSGIKDFLRIVNIKSLKYDDFNNLKPNRYLSDDALKYFSYSLIIAETEESLKIAKHLLKLVANKQDPDYLKILGNYYLQIGDIENALKTYDKGIKIILKTGQIQQNKRLLAILFNNKAFIILKHNLQELYDKAISWLKISLSYFPEFDWAKVNYIILSLLNNKNTEKLFDILYNTDNKICEKLFRQAKQFFMRTDYQTYIKIKNNIRYLCEQAGLDY